MQSIILLDGKYLKVPRIHDAYKVSAKSAKVPTFFGAQNL
jgi:hypothetical protein